jgi:protein SCO1/2
VVIGALMCAPLPAASPQSGDGHQHHASLPSGLDARAGLALMDPQPRIGDVALVDSRGQTMALRDVLDGDVPVVVNFIFTSCTTICPVMSAGFAQLGARLQSEHRPGRLVSISIDPEFDTPSRLREYAARKRAGENWVFLTGSPAAVEAAQLAFGAFRGGKESHTPATFLRRSAAAPWLRLDGLASADLLWRAYRGASSGGHD